MTLPLLSVAVALEPLLVPGSDAEQEKIPTVQLSVVAVQSTTVAVQLVLLGLPQVPLEQL